MKKTKGIILAGGSGTRLYPMTKGISKQLLPIYDKPMIYYPLSVLLLAGIKEILIISNSEFLPMYQMLLEDGSKLGIKIEYIVQEKPRGLADAFILGEDFIGEDNVCLILGDNIFYGKGFSGVLNNAIRLIENSQQNKDNHHLFNEIKDTSLQNIHNNASAVVFAYYVKNPTEFGVVEFDKNGTAISIEEKPIHPKSHYAVPGLYFYDNSVVEVAKNVTPSARGEIEISSINDYYLKSEKLKVETLGRGFAWLDTGTNDGLLEASNFVRTIQKRQGWYIACLEEIAFKKGFITKEQLLNLSTEYNKTDYGQYLLDIANDLE
ncbi:MAG: sugar nucleotidyltransferase [Candidatus Kapaibacteriota bacterium]|jgi:glucose-1-phosphate thymidylyltransferase